METNDQVARLTLFVAVSPQCSGEMVTCLEVNNQNRMWNQYGLYCCWSGRSAGGAPWTEFRSAI